MPEEIDHRASAMGLIAALHEAIEHLTASPWCSPSGQPQPAIHEAMITELRRQLAAAEAEAAELA
jgi:hypothetical protein